MFACKWCNNDQILTTFKSTYSSIILLAGFGRSMSLGGATPEEEQEKQTLSKLMFSALYCKTWSQKMCLESDDRLESVQPIRGSVASLLTNTSWAKNRSKCQQTHVAGHDRGGRVHARTVSA